MGHFYVDPDNGDDDTGAGTWDDPYKTTQVAINGCTGTDTVWLTGTEVLDTQLDTTGLSPAIGGPFILRGWDGATEFGDGWGVLDGNNDIATILDLSTDTTKYVLLYRIEFENVTYRMLWLYQYNAMISCVMHDGADIMCRISQYVYVTDCEFYNGPTSGYCFYVHSIAPYIVRNYHHSSPDGSSGLISASSGTQATHLFDNIFDMRGTTDGGSAVSLRNLADVAGNNTVVGIRGVTTYAIRASEAGAVIRSNIVVGCDMVTGQLSHALEGWNQFYDYDSLTDSAPQWSYENLVDADPMLTQLDPAELTDYTPRKPRAAFPRRLPRDNGLFNYCCGAVGRPSWAYCEKP
jgi:hypothetical protein